MNVLGYVRMVLWGFFGVRRAGADRHIGRIKPLPLIAIAIVLASSFVLLLMCLARFAVELFG